MSKLGRVVAAVVLIVATAGACSDSPEKERTSQVEVEIEIELRGGQRWSASAASVASGLICEGGSHRWVGYRDKDGSAVEYDDAAALNQMQQATVLIETQLGCADGSGAVSIAWEPYEHDRWMIVGGSGAYSNVTGSGLVAADEDDQDRSVVLGGTISTR